jgi:hypothetical protein
MTGRWSALVQFEHLIEINDLSTAEVPNLTREEVWFGLLCRAEDPRPFLPGLESCEILSREDTVLSRRLNFGQVVIHDTVRWAPMDWISFESLANDEHPAGLLTITVEEPEPGSPALFLRFSYRTGLADVAGEDVRYAEFIRSAYHQSDVDTVRVIRMIAESTRTE